MTRTVESRLKVSLLDGVSGPAAKAGAALQNLQKRSAFRYTMGSGLFAAGGAIAASTKRFTTAASEFGAALTGPGGIMAGLAGVAQGHSFVQFTEHMNRIRAATMASKEEMAALQEEIFKVSRRHARVYSEVAEGALQLVKSGKDIHETIGALDATVGASVAIEKSVGHAAETLTDIIYGMGLRVTNQQEAMRVFGDVADVAVAASFKFNQSYDEMSRALAKGAPIARVAGLSLMDIATIAGLTADENFKGAKAGAALASSIIRLASPTKKARAELAAAGIDLSKFTHATKDAQLGGKTLADVLSEELGVDAEALIPRFDQIMKDPRFKDNATMLGRELQSAISEGLGMDANSANIEKAREAVDTFLRGSMSRLDVIGIFRELAAKNADANFSLYHELFGTNHEPAMIALTNAFRQGLYDKQSKLLHEQTPGAVARHEKENLEGLSGALYKLHSAWEQIGAAIFTKGGLGENLSSIFNHAAQAMYRFSEASPEVLKFAGYAATALAGSTALGAAFEVLKIATSGLRLAFVALTGPVGWVVGGLGALAAFHWEDLKARVGAWSEGFTEGFWDSLKIPDEVGQSWENLKKAVKDTTGANLDLPSWRELGETLGGAVASGVNALASAFKSVCDWVASAIQGVRDLAHWVSDLKMPSWLGGSPAPKVEGARASGGPVKGGRPYLVGERGPELFVPGSSGRIIPHGAKGGGIGAVTQHINFVIHSSGDLAAIAREVERRLSSAVEQAVRGAQADVGLRWA